MPDKRLSRPEFVALMAAMFATIAFSIDGMLPALPVMAAELSPAMPNKIQLVVVSFVLGMGLGTLFAGPLSDAMGRRPVILGGVALFAAGAAIAASATSLEMLILGRIVQGLGAAAPRIVALAIIRDLYAGRQMAQIMSFILLVFTMVPAIAPLLGSGIIALSSWRGVFLAVVIFAAMATAWLFLRQPESLPPDRRRPFRLPFLRDGLVQVAGNRSVMLTTVVLTFVLAMLFSVLQSVQPIFDITFGRAESFPAWFCLLALSSGISGLINARVVIRLGMEPVVTGALALQVLISGIVALSQRAGFLPDVLMFPVFLIWITSVFFTVGLTVGNLNAMAMEPLGHLAGTAASVVSAAATVLAAFLAVPLGLLFDGTPLPLATGLAAYSAVAWLYVRQLSGLMEDAEPIEELPR